MQNPFMSSDDGVETDEADRERAGGRADADSDKVTEEETKAADYRDDPSLLGASSDYAQRGTTNQYSGQSPGDESGNVAGGRETRGMHSGSQEQWRGVSPAASTAPSDAGGTDASQEDVHGSEAYGDAPQQKATDESEHGDEDAPKK